MKIALVDWVCDPKQVGEDGVSDVVWGMASRLAASGDDVHVIGPYPAAAAPVGGVTVHTFRPPPPGPRNIVGFLLHCAAAWATVRTLPAVDVIHTVEYMTAGVVTGLRVGPPVVMTTPCNIDERHTSVNPFDPTAIPVYKAMSRIAARRCATIIATSDAMIDWWQRYGIPRERIVRVPLGVDSRLFRPIARQQARDTLGWDAAPNVLFAGRCDEDNGPDMLLRAMPEVFRQVPAARLDMLGGGRGRPSMQRLARKLGIDARVRWLSRAPYTQLPLLYNASDVFAFPRLVRATPRVLLQALSCGMAVVTSALGAIDDFVQQGQTGWLVNPREPSQIAERIIQLLMDRPLAARLGDAAREYALHELDWDRLVPRLRAEVYQPLVQAKDAAHAGH